MTVKVDCRELTSMFVFNSFHFSNPPPECLNLTYSKSNTQTPSEPQQTWPSGVPINSPTDAQEHILCWNASSMATNPRWPQSSGRWVVLQSICPSVASSTRKQQLRALHLYRKWATDWHCEVHTGSMPLRVPSGHKGLWARSSWRAGTVCESLYWTWEASSTSRSVSWDITRNSWFIPLTWPAQNFLLP